MLCNISSSIYQVFLCRHHHHHVVPLARISLILSRHFSLSFITSGRSSGLHPVSSYNCCMYVRAARPVFARPYVGIHRSTSLMSSFPLLQQCPACLVHLTWIVFVMGGRWPCSWCLVGCCRQDCSILLATFLCNCRLASSRFVNVQVVHTYSSIDTTAAWKKLRFILSVRSDFYMIDRLNLIQFSVLSRTPLFQWGGVLPLYRGYNQRILNPADGSIPMASSYFVSSYSSSFSDFTYV